MDSISSSADPLNVSRCSMMSSAVRLTLWSVRVGVGPDEGQRVVLESPELGDDHAGRLVHRGPLGPRAVAGLLLGQGVRDQRRRDDLATSRPASMSRSASRLRS